ncbi:YdhK family protein [Caldibacillus lycopersici]|uniref:YdhK family protein n=1 Tax=Perspicuibacillus lycopersici TaxID=1325689 RepID=A0AAE3IR27_9BACI|nr:YdhK family protein [Perspicuibacillus lycopersici]MCU9612871.1 YdhK family protein [Perspicuibacillus lycopersici]
MRKKFYFIIFGLLAIFLLSACTDDASPTDTNNHEHMHHSSSGEVPEGLKKEENPTYPVGTKAIIQANHMEGMKGAVSIIVGAYRTTVYTVSYTPTTGGEKVKNHKWVIHEEIKDTREKPYHTGEVVILEADHMEGMKNATATIESAEQTTVYMVDFPLTTSGDEVKNHKWVTENELSPLH